MKSSVLSHSFRMRPGQDLKKELLSYCQKHQLQAACVVSSVGSLKQAVIRLAEATKVAELRGPFEIVSLTGTLSSEGIHLHISMSDSEGKVVGGHLMNGCEVFTTVEIVLIENMDLVFKREPDETTGYKELVIKKR